MKKWEQWEIDVLTNSPYDKHAILLPNRSGSSINHKRCKLGLKDDFFWTKDEIEILKNNTFSDAKTLLRYRTISSLHHKCSKLGIPHESRWSEEEIDILKNTTDKTISKTKSLLSKRTKSSVAHKLSRLKIKKHEWVNVLRRSSEGVGLSLEKINDIISDDKFNEVIDGCLLGDGCISCGKFNYSSVSKQHVCFVYDNLSKFGFRNIIHKYKSRGTQIKLRDRIVPITPSEFTYSYSIANKIIFPSIRKHWYPNGIKIVPEDVKITKLSCLLWYLGDGTLLKTNKGKSIRITLCTNGFSIEDHHLLKYKLEKTLDIDVVISTTGRTKYNNDIEYVLYLYGLNAYKFLKYIGPCVVDDYKHKWDIGNCKAFIKKCCICGKPTKYISNKKYPIKYRCRECKNYWTKEKIIYCIQLEHQKKSNLQARHMSINNMSLYHAGKRYFKTWEQAITVAGIDYNKIRLTKKWSADEVLMTIKQIYDEKKPSYQKLRDAARHYFGSFTEAKKIAGVLE